MASSVLGDGALLAIAVLCAVVALVVAGVEVIEGARDAGTPDS